MIMILRLANDELTCPAALSNPIAFVAFSPTLSPTRLPITLPMIGGPTIPPKKE